MIEDCLMVDSYTALTIHRKGDLVLNIVIAAGIISVIFLF